MPRNTDSYATLLEVALTHPLPPCFALAHRNTCLLQQRSGYFRAIRGFKENATVETKEPPKLSSRKISFKEQDVKVFVYNTKGIATDVSFEKNIPLCIQPRSIASGRFIQRAVWMCLVSNIPWGGTVWGQYHNLLENIRVFHPCLTIDIIRSDLRKIYDTFRRYRTAVINYKQSIRLPYQYPERLFNPKNRQWTATGRIIQVATKLRLYLIKVIRDSEIAAVSIQTAWRRKLAYKTIQHIKTLK